MRSYTAERVRLIADAEKSSDTTDALTAVSPDIWRGHNVSIELVVKYAGELVNMADFQSITLEVKDPDNITGYPLMARTVAGAALNAALTDEQAVDDGTSQHAVFRFVFNETLLDLKGAPSKVFWLFISATTNAIDQNGNPVTGAAPICKTTLTIRESGRTLGISSVPIIGSNIIPGGSNYDGSGNKVITLTANQIYEWTKNANDTTLVNGAQTLSSSGRFTADGSSVTLTGTIGAAVTATLRQPLFNTAEEIRAMLAGLLKSIGNPGELIGVRSQSGNWTGFIGIDDTGTFIMQPISTPSTP